MADQSGFRDYPVLWKERRRIGDKEVNQYFTPADQPPNSAFGIDPFHNGESYSSITAYKRRNPMLQIDLMGLPEFSDEEKIKSIYDHTGMQMWHDSKTPRESLIEQLIPYQRIQTMVEIQIQVALGIDSNRHLFDIAQLDKQIAEIKMRNRKKVHRCFNCGKRRQQKFMVACLIPKDEYQCIDCDAENRGKIPEREFPCNECTRGEMILTGTSPGYRESTQHYECNKCAQTLSFP